MDKHMNKPISVNKLSHQRLESCRRADIFIFFFTASKFGIFVEITWKPFLVEAAVLNWEQFCPAEAFGKCQLTFLSSVRCWHLGREDHGCR